MSNPYFQFQKFTVWHDQCAMRVGTDGVLLGAWAPVASARRVLDVGTGSGLIALMAAQRAPLASVVGIDIHEASVRQACRNVASSPFASRVEILLSDIRRYRPSWPFDAVLCNPPYHSESVLPPDPSRLMARNASALSFRELIASVASMLSPEGTFSVVLPVGERQSFVALCLASGLRPCRACEVSTVLGRSPKRVLLSFSPSAPLTFQAETLILQGPDGHPTPQYASLTSPFLLPRKP